jgi:hypothetical protein
MAANPKYSDTMVNAEADAVGDALNTGYIRIYDGSQPANADTAVGAQVLLAELRFGADAFGAASAGTITANAITQDSSANATGTATWARILASDGSTVWFDGSVAATGGTANVIINTTSIVSGAVITCSSLTFSVSKG